MNLRKGEWMRLTAIVPCYNEQEALTYFYDEITRVADLMPKVEFEVLYINDGSKDDTLSVLKEFAAKDTRMKYVSFSRNFGKEAAIYAGLQYATGDLVAIMDADLQDPPSLLPQMYQAIEEEGYDSIATRRVTRKGEPSVRSFFARMFYHIMNRISKTEIVDGARDFRLMNRSFVNALLDMGEYNRFSKGLFGWVGFNTKWLEYENVERVAGETKWSFWSLLRYSMDGILAFSTAPLSIASFMGVLFCIISFIMILVIVVKTLIWGEPVAGFPTLICIIFLLGGLILLSLGVIGQYIAKMYLEVKKRPIFLIKEEDHL